MGAEAESNQVNLRKLQTVVLLQFLQQECELLSD